MFRLLFILGLQSLASEGVGRFSVISLVLMFSIPVAEAGETIYIRVDGSIDPPSANITSADNVTYTLIGNVNDSVVVQRANIVLDGAGYTVQGTGSGVGINVTGVSNVTVKNCIIKSFQFGIYLDVGANNGRVENNTIQNLQGAQGENAVGIHLKSNDNTLFNNTIASLAGGTGGTGGGSQVPGSSGGTAAGVYVSTSTGNNLTSNTVSSLTGGTGGTGGADTGSGGSGGTSAGICLAFSTRNNVFANTFSNLTRGTGGAGGPYTYGSAPPRGAEGTSAGILLDSESYNNNITALTAQGSYRLPDLSKLNTLEGKPILYFYNENSVKVSDFNVTTQTAPILIGGSTQTGTLGGPVTGVGSGGISTGLTLISTANSVISNNMVSGFGGMPGGTGMFNYGSGGTGGTSVGIYLLNSTNNSVTSNTVSNLTAGTGGPGGDQSGAGGSGGFATGIYLSGSINNDATTNTVSNLTGGTGGTGGNVGGAGGDATGIYFFGSANNSLVSNMVMDLVGGTGTTGQSAGGARGISYSMYLYQSNLTAIKANTLDNVDYGLYLYSSNHNNIYHNNFIANASRISISNSNNTWDNGYPSGGNYWSNYTGVDNYHGPYQNETGSDGIGDTPYVIDENNQDKYPLIKPYPWGLHDIGIAGITTSKTVVGQGFNLNINTTIFNYGDNTETFNVTVYCNETAITLPNEENYTTVTLASGESTTVAIAWNTSGFGYGIYNMIVYATPVSGETDTTDNNSTGGWVLVTIPGDVDGDLENGHYDVDLFDAVRLLACYGAKEGDPNFDPNCDIDNTGQVFLFDAVILLSRYGQKYP